MPESTEQPLYILPQEKKRSIIPRVLLLLLLGLIFYFGVLLNVSMLKLFPSTESTIKLISLIILSAIIVLGIIFNIIKSKQKYFFYKNRITFQNRQILLHEITNTTPKQNLLDKLFKTYSLTLNQKFSIKNIPRQIQLKEYIQKLITYSQH